MNEVHKKITGNFIWLIAGDAINKVSMFLISILVAHHLGVEQFGRYSLALTYGFFFTIVADLGLNTVIIRDVSADNKLLDKYVVNGLLLKILLSFISLALYLSLLYFLDYPLQTFFVLASIGSSLVIQSVSYIYKDIFHAAQKMKLDSISLILEKLFLLFGVVFIFFVVSESLLAVGLLFIFSALFSIAISYLIYRFKFGHGTFCFDYQLQKYLIKEAWPFAFLFVFLVIYYKIGIVMLSLLLGDFSVGIYNAAYQIIEGLTVFPMLLMAAAFPAMNQAVDIDIKKLRRLTYSLLLVLIGIYFFFFSILNLLGDSIIVLLFGNRFISSAEVLNPLLYALFFLFCLRPLGSLMTVLHKQKIMLFYVVLVMVIDIILNLLFIPHYSVVGAAYATVISTFLLCMCCVYSTRKILFGID